MIKIMSKADVRRLEKRACHLLRHHGWHVKIARSPVSPSVYLYCQSGARNLRIRISDHVPKPHVIPTMNLLVHPGGDTIEDLAAFIKKATQTRLGSQQKRNGDQHPNRGTKV